MKECDAVFEGGGVKGIGLVGAVNAFESGGYLFKNVAGSSAGAIVASLIAAGYGGTELKSEMEQLDYGKLREKDFLDYFGIPGKLLSLSQNFGIYATDYFESWLSGLLSKKRIAVFSDLDSSVSGEKYRFGHNKCRLQLTVSDVTSQQIRVFPDDLSLYGIDPDGFSVAAAVRMSISIPVFYEPYILKDTEKCLHFMVDGGLLSNYPVWILDEGGLLERPVIGFRFGEVQSGECKIKDEKSDNYNLVEYVKSIVTTVLDAHDTQYISNVTGDRERTVSISTTVKTQSGEARIKSTDFDITEAQTKELFLNGYRAGEDFLKSWNFERWMREYR